MCINIKLSIILPVYNVEKYIERCLCSILPQIKESAIEVLIVDDESPDDSISLAESVIEDFSDVSVSIIHQDNKGLGGARNTGLRASRGEYVWFIDSDDEIVKDSLKEVLKYVSIDDIVIFDYESVDKDGHLINKSYFGKNLKHVSGREIEQHFLLSQAWRSIYRRSFLVDNNIYFKEHYLHEDGEFNMRSMCKATSISYFKIVSYRYYTQNGNSIMNNIKLKNISDLFLYFDTANTIRKGANENAGDYEYIIKKHLLVAISLIFLNSTRLSNKDFNTFKSLLKEKREDLKRILNISELGMYCWLINMAKVYFPNRRLYNFIYYKHF